MDLDKVAARVLALLRAPRNEWPVIAAEPATVADLYTGYVAIVAAIPAICGFLSLGVIGTDTGFSGAMRVGVGSAFAYAVVNYLLSLAAVLVLAMIIDALAPTFGGQRDRVQAVKAAAYSYTASGIAGIGLLLPWIGTLLAVAGAVYGIYLLYVGLPHTMKAPPGRAAGYTAVTVIAGIALAVLIGALASSALRGTGGPGYVGASDGPPGVHSGEPSAPAALAASAEPVEEAAGGAESAQDSGDDTDPPQALAEALSAALGIRGAEPIETERIQSFFPDELAGLRRVELTAHGSAAMGIRTVRANARYADAGGQELQLEITDTGGFRGPLGLADWAAAESDVETDRGYERTRRDRGRSIHERWDRNSRLGEYGVVVAQRFIVEVSGHVAEPGDLQRAIDDLDLDGLEALGATEE